METILEYWPVVTALIGLAVWGIRLESLAKMNKRDNEHLTDRVDRMDSDIKVALGKIDGRLELIATSLERVIWRIPRGGDNGPNDKGDI